MRCQDDAAAIQIYVYIYTDGRLAADAAGFALRKEAFSLSEYMGEHNRLLAVEVQRNIPFCVTQVCSQGQNDFGGFRGPIDYQGRHERRIGIHGLFPIYLTVVMLL